MQTIEIKRQQCRYIFTDGHRCGSPALRAENFCYYHHESRQPAARLRRATFEFPPLEDRRALQQALEQTLTRVASGQLDPRRAGLLLYGLQLAVQLLPKPSAAPEPTVETVLDDPTHGPLAEPTEYTAPGEEETALTRLLRDLQSDETPTPTILPSLEAHAEVPTQSRPEPRPNHRPHKTLRPNHRVPTPPLHKSDIRHRTPPPPAPIMAANLSPDGHKTMSIAPFHILAKPIGPICNLDCTYCFYLEKQALYPSEHKWAMPPQVLDSYIRQYIEQQDTHEIAFAWQGGEPTLLGVDYFKNILALQRRYANGKSITNAFQTNGVLLDDTWATFLADNRFLVGISIDGPRHLHDAYRLDKSGHSTFNRVLAGIETLRRHRVEFNTLTTVHRANSTHPLEVYRFLREIGSGYMQFIPIVERSTSHTTADGLTLISPTDHAPARLTPWSVDASEFGNFLCSIFDEWVRHDVGTQFIQLFDTALQVWYGLPAGLCVFSETCGNALAIEHSGDVYSCDHFVYPQNRLGNLLDHPLEELVTSPLQRDFGLAKRDSLPTQCRECDVLFACHGECPKHRFTLTRTGEPGLNYLCPAYKKFFHHINPYMNFMASQLMHQRAPAAVMQWTLARDAQAALASAERNDPCPCGSGRKFKRCCGTTH